MRTSAPFDADARVKKLASLTRTDHGGRMTRPHLARNLRALSQKVLFTTQTGEIEAPTGMTLRRRVGMPARFCCRRI